MNWINKLERKFGKYAIRNLMYYVCIAYAAGFILQNISYEAYYNYLSLDAEAILRGQVWRIFTFLLDPPSDNLFFIIFAVYLYYMIGSSLENYWGAFRFNLYFFTGVLLHVIAALVMYGITDISFPMDTFYLNLSLFFAFAAIYPDVELMLFFILPIKIKWLAMLNGVYFMINIGRGFLPSSFTGLTGGYKLLATGSAIAACISILNFLIFFFSMRKATRITPETRRRKKKFKREVREHTSVTRHKCAICGRTDQDDENLEFRFCSKCDGNYEYCQDHLFTHEHVKK